MTSWPSSSSSVRSIVRTSRSSSATRTGGSSFVGIEAGTPLNGVPSLPFLPNSRLAEYQRQGCAVSRLCASPDVRSPITGRGHFRHSDVLIHGAQEVHIHALLFPKDAQTAELPPFIRGEVGGDLRLGAGLGEPLNQGQVVGL